jgi:hypothetical protein
LAVAAALSLALALSLPLPALALSLSLTFALTPPLAWRIIVAVPFALREGGLNEGRRQNGDESESEFQGSLLPDSYSTAKLWRRWDRRIG